MALFEASFLTRPGLPPDLHLTARQAAEHAARAGAGHLVLTHLIPWNDPDAPARKRRPRLTTAADVAVPATYRPVPATSAPGELVRDPVGLTP